MPDDLEDAPDLSTLQAQLNVFNEQLKALGGRDVVYGFAAHRHMLARHDLIMVKTLPADTENDYTNSGGVFSDPVADALMKSQKEPFFIDIGKLIEEESERRFVNPYSRALRSRGYCRVWCFPFHEADHQGFGALSVFQDEAPGAPDLDPEVLKPLVLDFHVRTKNQGHLGGVFKLTDREIDVLWASALGHAANWVADRDDVSVRAVELRLQSARRKLRARSTTEAVYKATVYGILRID